MQRADPVLVFDLDGTVLRINSFPVWVAFLALGGAGNLPLKQRTAVAGLALRLLLMRKLHRIDHATFLRQMQELWHFATAGDGGATVQRLVGILRRSVRPNLVPALKLVIDGVLDGGIATAAAEEYAVPLGERLGVAHVLATRSGRDAGEPDNSGEHKLIRVRDWLTEQGWTDRPLIFFNDHLADLPLMRVANVVCWFGSTRSLEQAKRDAVTARFVDCRKMNAREMHATMAHLCQSVTITRLQSYNRSRASTLA
jgi:phosphoserine phosphatase